MLSSTVAFGEIISVTVRFLGRPNSDLAQRAARTSDRRCPTSGYPPGLSTRPLDWAQRHAGGGNATGASEAFRFQPRQCVLNYQIFVLGCKAFRLVAWHGDTSRKRTKPDRRFEMTRITGAELFACALLAQPDEGASVQTAAGEITPLET